MRGGVEENMLPHNFFLLLFWLIKFTYCSLIFFFFKISESTFILAHHGCTNDAAGPQAAPNTHSLGLHSYTYEAFPNDLLSVA